MFELKMDGGISMRVGAFLFGSLVGAAAVIYLNNKSKSMLLSAFSGNNQSVRGMVNKATDKITGTMNNSQTASHPAAANTAGSTGSTGQAGFNQNQTASRGGLEKVENIVQEDPELRVTVGEILASNHQNKEAAEVLQPH
jgi:hypothetical protein